MSEFRKQTFVRRKSYTTKVRMPNDRKKMIVQGQNVVCQNIVGMLELRRQKIVGTNLIVWKKCHISKDRMSEASKQLLISVQI